MSVVLAADLAKDMAGTPLFRGVSFRLGRRDRMTLSGRNGAGKTTLLRMLAGETSVDGGELVFEKGAKIALHDQRPPRDRDVSLRDYVLSGCAELIALEEQLASLEARMAEGELDDKVFEAYSTAQARLEHAGGYDWRKNVESILRGLGLRESYWDRTIDTFSGGELTRASLARALAGAPDVLLLDEPTNHLDIESLEWLEERLKTIDAAVVLVAHDRWFLEAVGTSVLEMEGGRAKFFKGTWHQWRKEKAAQELALGRAIERQEAEIAKLERFVTRFRAGTRSRQAQSRQKKLDKMERVSRDPKDSAGLGFSFKPPERTGRVVFELLDGRLTIGERVLLDGAELWLERGEHVSLIGPNGTGKTTLLAALTGERELDGGKLLTGHNLKVGVLSQHAEELHETGTVLEACQRATKLTPNHARALLGRFLFSGEAAEKPVSGLSGGERRRLSLAILVQSGANVLVLDEPTNHLDLESREALEDALRGYPGSVLLVSHDRALLDAVGTRTISVEDGKLRSYDGGWAEYLRVREERAADERAAKAAGSGAGGGSGPAKKAASPAPTKAPASSNGGAATKTLSKNQAKQVARLEREIEAAEAALASLEEELADPSAWADRDRSRDATRRHEAAKREVEQLYERLDALS